MGFFLLTLRAGSVIFFSLLLGALAMVYVGIEHPTTLESMLVQAGHFKSSLTDTANTGLDPSYNVWFKFLIQEQQFVFMFFVIVMRMVLLLVFAGIPALYRWLWSVPGKA
ncbi:MAG: hypothetical protein CBC34_001030 [Hyphomicrobiaceae bacterium TMED74]|nr:hypothetical protein [Filomicrobium sp.]RPG48005.1 MAG: hypothetical protein CBC34_001030 [Hyphomicrobiaceae bacterium TMED74]